MWLCVIMGYLEKSEMNERIKQLAEQAGSTHKQNLGVYQFFTDELEKFAELIVAECIGVAVDNGCGDFVDIEHLLLKHFGVE